MYLCVLTLSPPRTAPLTAEFTGLFAHSGMTYSVIAGDVVVVVVVVVVVLSSLRTRLQQTSLYPEHVLSLSQPSAALLVRTSSPPLSSTIVSQTSSH